MPLTTLRKIDPRRKVNKKPKSVSRLQYTACVCEIISNNISQAKARHVSYGRV